VKLLLLLFISQIINLIMCEIIVHLLFIVQNKKTVFEVSR